MDRCLKAVIGVVLAIIAVSVVLVAESSDADPTEYTIKGKVVDNSSAALSGVTVTITSDDNTIGTAITDSNGIFEITKVTNLTKLNIFFSSEGKVITACDSAVMPISKGVHSLKLDSLTPVGDVYTIPNVTMMNACITMYIMDENAGGNIPLKNAMVTLSSGDYASIETIDDAGKVTLSLSDTWNLTLRVHKDGYTPLPSIFFMTVNTDGTVSFNLRGTVSALGASYSVPYTDSDGMRTYVISEKYPLLCSASTGNITAYVLDERGRALEGATVTIVNPDNSNQKYTTQTDKNGEYTFTGVTTGTYNMTVSVGGFETISTSGVTVNKGSNTLEDTIMTQKTEQNFFGMNLGHVMMTIGVFLGVVLVIFAYLLYSRRLNSRLDAEGDE